MNISDFDYILPDDLIAQTPADKRDKCRLLIYDREKDERLHTVFGDIINHFTNDDVLILNNSKVIPCRILFDNQKKELMLIRKLGQGKYDCMIRPGRKFKIGLMFRINDKLKGIVTHQSDTGRVITFFDENDCPADDRLLYEAGDIPLPPYITNYSGDKKYYQTVYSKIEGSTAAPTAGLHFTDELLNRIKNKICDIMELTLHIGPGTFQPIKCENIIEHQMHSEYYNINENDYAEIIKYKNAGKRIIAVGTTVVRTLETVFSNSSNIPKLSGETDIFIFPGHHFKCVDAMITNFHLPRSSLLVMLSAFTGREKILSLYEEAVSLNYRFFSFGDAMFIK